MCSVEMHSAWGPGHLLGAEQENMSFVGMWPQMRRERVKPYWLEKWCPRHTTSVAVSKLLGASMAGGIKKSGLKQDV